MAGKWSEMAETGSRNIDNEQKRPRGRPRIRRMPDPIPDTPENVLKALVAPWPPKVSRREIAENAHQGG